MDRLTQLQDLLDKLLVTMYTSVGVLQRDAELVPLSRDVPVTCWTLEQVKEASKSRKHLARTSSVDIVTAIKNCTLIVESLPESKTEEEHQRELETLESQNVAAGEELERAMHDAERLSEKIRSTIKDIVTYELSGRPSNLPNL